MPFLHTLRQSMRFSMSVYSRIGDIALYAGRMILLELISSSILCADQPAILAVAKSGVNSSSGMPNILYTKPL